MEGKVVCTIPFQCSARCQCASYGLEEPRPFHAVRTCSGVLWVEILEALQDFVSNGFYYDLLNTIATHKFDIVVMRRDTYTDRDVD